MKKNKRKKKTISRRTIMARKKIKSKSKKQSKAVRKKIFFYRKLRNKKKYRFIRKGEFKLLLMIFVVTCLIFIGISSLFYSVQHVSGYGMMPTLRNKDILITSRKKEFKRFDIVVINNGIENEYRRIIGLPGEQVKYQDDTLFVDNQPVDEKFLVSKVNESQAKGKNFTEDISLSNLTENNQVPKDCYFVLGDNRPYTTDSRDYRFIKKQSIGGKIISRVWPLDEAVKF